jgi:hypothetical protein
MKNDKQALEYNKKHNTNHQDKQPNNTRLTQGSHGSNLTWNCSCQTIAAEIQLSCRMKNDDTH